MAVLSVGLGVALWGALVGALWAASRRLGELQETLRPIGPALEQLAAHPEAAFSARLAEVEDLVDRMPKKWGDITREAAASEARARSHIRRAQKELEARGFTDEGVDQVGYELGLVDGGRGEDGPLQPVPEDVAQAEPIQAGPEDWKQVARSHKFGG